MYENNRGLPHSFGFYDALQLLMAGGIWYDYIRRIGLWHAPILVWATLCANLMCHSIFYSNVDTMERCTNNDRQIRERNIAAGTHRETGRNIYREREREIRTKTCCTRSHQVMYNRTRYTLVSRNWTFTMAHMYSIVESLVESAGAKRQENQPISGERPSKERDMCAL